MSAKSHNIQMLEIVASGLKELLAQTVFVGGASTILYLNEKDGVSEASIRPTDDVDCVVEISSRADYRGLEEKLRSLGFKNSMEAGAPLCRWLYSGVIVDIMPTDASILGFSNKWYVPAIKKAVTVSLPSDTKIRIFSVPYFLGAKFEAFKGRGKMGFLGSKDFEDIITVIDGRPEIRNELFGAPDDLKTYLREQISTWKQNDNFLQSILAHLPNPRRNTEGARRVLDILNSI